MSTVTAPTQQTTTAPSLLVGWLAVLFAIGCLGTIPYAAPPAQWFVISLSALGMLTLGAARFDRSRCWHHLTIWPVTLTLAAWAIAIGNCAAPDDSLVRSASMAMYSMLFITTQITMMRGDTCKALLWAITATIVTCSADVAVQRWTGKSLISGASGGADALTGSQGNRNDFAVVGVLLPFASLLFPGIRGTIALAATALLTSPAWIFTSSRQAAIGWFIGGIGPFFGRARIKPALIVAFFAVLLGATAVASMPALRKRAIQTWKTGLAEREEIIALGVSLFASHPLTGIGPGLYGRYYKQAALNDWEWRGKKLPKHGMPWVHCLPVEVLCETGLIGGAVTVAVVGGALLRARRMALHGVHGRAVAAAVLASLAAVALMGLVDLAFIKDWMRCCWWLVLGVAFARFTTIDTAARTPANKI